MRLTRDRERIIEYFQAEDGKHYKRQAAGLPPVYCWFYCLDGLWGKWSLCPTSEVKMLDEAYELLSFEDSP